MAASKFTRNKDYTDDANTNTGGRDYIDPAGVDGEMDEILTVTDDHADKLDILLRDDQKMQDLILQGHEFSSVALSILMGLLNQTGYINYRQDWVTTTDYIPGDLVTEPVSQNTYFCLVAHTSTVFATDLAALNWHLFVPAGSTGLPAFVANQVLSNNGVIADWRTVGVTEAPTLAPNADPFFSGTVTMPLVNFTGRLNFSRTTLTFSAASQTLDFDGTFIKTIDVTAHYTAAIMAINIAQGRVQEVHFNNTIGAAQNLLWDANWTWMGYAPATIGANKKAVLTLRVPTGNLATDVIAMWSEEP